MSAIKTSIPIELDIDGEVYDVTLRDPSIKEKKEIEDMGQGHSEAIESIQTCMYEVEMLRREFTMNTELLKDPSMTEKIALIKETKKLNREIHEKSSEYSKLIKALASLEHEAEAAYKKRFSLLVSGDKKADLESVIEKSGLRYSAVFKHIEESIAKSREKK